jgi:hypothetical protein
VNTARATSFATRRDLAAFAICVSSGESVRHCLSVGDNGVGKWNEPTWKPHGDAICALHHSIARHNAIVVVQLSIGHKRPFRCFVRDVSPVGVIDLNPAALIAAGLDQDADLDCAATWHYLAADA